MSNSKENKDGKRPFQWGRKCNVCDPAALMGVHQPSILMTGFAWPLVCCAVLCSWERTLFFYYMGWHFCKDHLRPTGHISLHFRLRPASVCVEWSGIQALIATVCRWDDVLVMSMNGKWEHSVVTKLKWSTWTQNSLVDLIETPSTYQFY